jgi:hypothetical protein
MTRVHGEEAAALERAARLAAGGRRVRVPLAATTMSEAGFLERVLEAVRRHHAEPALITFEVSGDRSPRVRRVQRALFACRFSCEA